TAGGIVLEPAEYELVLESAAPDAAGETSSTALALLPGGGFALLDTTTTPELDAEGLARDVIRAVQETRKAAGFDVSDRITLDLVFFSDADADAVRSVAAGGSGSNAGAVAVAIDDETLATRFTVVSPKDFRNLEQYREVLVSEWIGRMVSTPPEHFARVEKGRYANSDLFIVAVSRPEGVRDV
ncbi:MAG: isoleucyl-tRNA synthetase, partial [Subtercola sp.]|nr:isoleucyl-tRNA synthetase [Subtercola sp.]